MKKTPIISILCAIAFGIALQSYRPINADSPCPVTKEQCPITVVFDVGGVLMEISTRSALWQLGPRNLFSYLIRNRSISGLKRRFFKILNLVDSSKGNSYGANSPDGQPLPKIMASWLMSKQPNAQILAHVTEQMEQHPEWFKNKQEHIILEALAKFMFNPNSNVNTTHPIYEMVQFARQCKEKGYRLFILSNWDAESFDLLTQKYPEIFQLFDEIIVSGNEHLMKPDPAIFKLITDLVPAGQCIFIDDQKENIDAARAAGMHAILAAPRRSLISKLPDMEMIRAKFDCIVQEICPTIKRPAFPIDSSDTGLEAMQALQAE